MKTKLQVMGWINIIVWSLAVLVGLGSDTDFLTLVGCGYIIWTGITMVQASKLIKK